MITPRSAAERNEDVRSAPEDVDADAYEREVVTAAERLSRAVLGTPLRFRDVDVRLSLVDEPGRLRTLRPDGSGRTRSPAVAAAPVQAVLESGMPALLDLPSDGERACLVIPLRTRRSLRGLLQVVAPRRLLEGREWAFEAVAAQLASAVDEADERRRLTLEVRSLEGVVALASELAGASTPKMVVDACLRLVDERLGTPVAAWMASGDDPELALSDVRGLEPDRRSRLWAGGGTVPASIGSDGWARQEELIARLLGAHVLPIVRRPEAFVVAIGVPEPMRPSISLVRPLAHEAIDRSIRGPRSGHALSLDPRVAWVAHEIRGPLRGVRAALQALWEDASEQDRGLLLRSVRELEEVGRLANELLQEPEPGTWLRREQSDVVRVAQQAIASCRLEFPERPVTLDATATVPAAVDPIQLRSAISNVIRNAIAYSPDDARVEVSVGIDDVTGGVRIGVHDEGTGLSGVAADGVVGPFVRGTSAEDGRGAGLGLFIARRVVEAHGGILGVFPGPEGTTVRMQLPGLSSEQAAP